MIFDVMVQEGYTSDGKNIYNVYRIHDTALTKFLRKVQDDKKYIFSVIPLFRNKMNVKYKEDLIDQTVENMGYEDIEQSNEEI